MQFGVCTSIEKSPVMKEAGWDFIEEHVQNLLQGHLPESEWKGPERLRAAALPVYAANCLVPGAMKITGPEADLSRLEAYMRTVLDRAARMGMKTLVFGSGGARKVPDGWDPRQARRQILDFGRMATSLAEGHGITLVLEPLNRKECNVITSVTEAMTYVREIGRPGFACLVDSYHFWLNNEPLEDLRPAVPWIRHVHVSDADRTPPGNSGKSSYRPFFRALKEGGYSGPLSVEASGFQAEVGFARKVLDYLRTEWEQA